MRRIIALEIDEVSLVARGANQFAKVALLKSRETKSEDEQLREQIDILDRAWEVSERAAKRCSLALAPIYEAYDRALRDVVARRVSAEAGALSILAVTKAQLLAAA